jgi:hypothetical protein
MAVPSLSFRKMFKNLKEGWGPPVSRPGHSLTALAGTRSRRRRHRAGHPAMTALTAVRVASPAATGGHRHTWERVLSSRVGKAGVTPSISLPPSRTPSTVSAPDAAPLCSALPAFSGHRPPPASPPRGPHRRPAAPRPRLNVHDLSTPPATVCLFRRKGPPHRRPPPVPVWCRRHVPELRRDTSVLTDPTTASLRHTSVLPPPSSTERRAPPWRSPLR